MVTLPDANCTEETYGSLDALHLSWMVNVMSSTSTEDVKIYQSMQ